MANNKDFKVKNGIQPTAYHENVGTVTSGSVTLGYDLSTVSYDSVSFSVATQSTIPSDIVIGDNDTKMFICSDSGNEVLQYSLSTAKDLSTASYDSVSFSVSSQDLTPKGLAFKPDGTKMYMVGNSNRRIYQYSLSTAWSLSTASYDNKSYYVYSQEQSPETVAFSSDGTKMYVAGQTAAQIFQYTLSTAWDVSTASYDSVSLNPADSPYNINIIFSPDGTKMYNMGAAAYKNVDEYSLSTAWDLSTATYTSNSFNWSTEESVGTGGISLSSDGTKLYLVGSGNDTVYQYSVGPTISSATLDMSTGTVFEITPTANTQIGLSNPAASGTVSQATLLLDGAAASSYNVTNPTYTGNSVDAGLVDTGSIDVWFKPDGTKMFVAGGNLAEFHLDTAWDVSTATWADKYGAFDQNSAFGKGIYISSDGVNVYQANFAGGNDYIYHYTMSTAWDVETLSYVGNTTGRLSVQTRESEPQDVFFKPDGTKLFVVGSLGDEVNEFSLSTAWNISTATFTTNFSLSSQDTNPTSIFFHPDGTTMWIIGATTDDIFEYTLTTAWDVSTASYSGNSWAASSQDPSPLGFFIDASGTRMYLLGGNTDDVFQYSIGSTATITYDDSIQFSGGTAPDSPAVGDTDVLTFSTRDGGTTYQGNLAIDGAK